MSGDPSISTKLDELMAAIRGYDDPRRAAGEWKHVHKLLKDTPLPAGRVTHVVGMRDVAGLAEMIDQLRTPADAPLSSASPSADAPTAETCSRALRAFRKRLKLTILDEDSKLGRGPLSKGARSRDSAAITPPVEWPESVWQELVRRGKLHHIGHGLYELGKSS